MSDPNAKSTKEIAKGLLRIAEKAALGVLIFLAIFVFNTLMQSDRRMTKLETKLDDDLSQWNRLKQHDERLMDLEVQITILRELDKLKREWRAEWEEELPVAAPPVPQPDDDDDDEDEQPIQNKPPFIPKDELFKKLEELKRKESLKDYRNRHMLEQRQAPPNVQAPRK